MYKQYFKNSNQFGQVLNKFSLIILGIILSIVTVLCAAFPGNAIAAEGDSSTGITTATDSNSTASSDVYLKSNDEQLSFTAPTRIDFLLDADGDFTTPTDVKFQNDSVLDIEVVNYKIQSEEGCTGVDDADDPQYASQQDVYSVKVIPTHSTSNTGNNEYSFSTSYNLNNANSNPDWVITAAEKSISLLFDKGRMPHPSRKWANTGAKLQTVTWTVKAASN